MGAPRLRLNFDLLVACSFGANGLELAAIGAALAHGWGPLLRGGAPPHRITMGPVQKNQTT